MAIDKDPSIYRDRGMIGSSDELDEYGVWVKSEPEDIASAQAQVTPIEEPTLPDIEDLPDLELDSTEAFDFPEPAPESKDQEEAEESVPSISENEKLDFAISESGSDSGEALPSFEDIASFETEIPPVSNEDFTELSMDDFLDVETSGGEASSVAAAEEETLDIDLDFQDSVETPQSAGVVEDFGFQIEDETPEPKTGNEKAISLETVSDFDDFLNDLSDTESQGAEAAPAAQAPVAEETTESEAIEDISIDVEESEPLTTAFESVDEAADIVLSDFETTESEQEPSISLDTSAAESGFESSITEEPFDDIAALSRDLAETETSEVEYPSSSPAPAADAGLSTQLLMRIAEELSSIKTELSSLKDELSVLRGEVKPEQVEEKAPPSSHGFFDEEDDEKIALTGDELDNILNTADFTEEAGADATADLSDEAVIDDFLMDRDDLLGGEAETAPVQEEALTFGEELEAEPAIERIELGDEPVQEVPEELQVLQQTGVKPMTAAPDDTSYLEADDLTTTDLDLTQAVIDEPDLGGTIFEEVPVEEPSIEAIHLDLDMEEALHVEGEESPEGEADFENIELTLDEFVGEVQEEGGPSAVAIKEEPLEVFEETEEAPVAEESFAEVVPEGFVVEAEETSEPLIGEAEQAEAIETVDLAEEPQTEGAQPLPVDIRQEVRTVLSYMDQLLESLPEDKIEEFAKSEYFDTYKKLFEELGLV